MSERDPKQAPDRARSSRPLPKLKPMKLDGFELDLDYYLKTHYASVYSANAELPSIIEWVNENLETAIYKKHMAKALLKQAEGMAFHDLRDPLKFEQFGFAGKPTEKAIDAAIPQLNYVVEANENYAKAAALVSRLINTLISLQAKLDLVRTSEATRRAVVEGDDARGEEQQ